MINEQLINPKSIVIVGASNDIRKPGGKLLKNLLDGNYQGEIYVMNVKEDFVQGIKSFRDADELPDVDLGIMAIPAKLSPPVIKTLAEKKKTRAFIIVSAGFSEESEEGAKYEKEIVDIINSVDGCLIGPNGIGFLNQNYNGLFTSLPRLDSKGIDFISGSGAVAVFTIDAAMPKGLAISSIWSVGNSAQVGVEDVIKYMDEHFDPEKDSKIKLLYFESINKPQMLLKHASSLIRKGCKIAAIKSGSSEAGSRAASSHTGALATPDIAVEALFKKAGIIRCYSRKKLVSVASVFSHKEVKGKNFAIITHAGGSAVMLTDVLSNGGFNVPCLNEHPASKELAKHLFPGSSVSNPIDFLATGTAEQLDTIIDYCENKFENIDAMVIIFGSPGLFDVTSVYNVINEKMKTCKKPIFPVLPSIVNAKKEIEHFLSQGRIIFTDEVVLGRALVKVYGAPKVPPEKIDQPKMDIKKIREIIDNASNGYLSPQVAQELLKAADIPIVEEAVVTSKEDAIKIVEKFGYPVVMKVVGTIHKSDVGGVSLNIQNKENVEKEFEKLMNIEGTTGVLIQPMLSGLELFVGTKNEPKFGHMVLCGLGGIFIEVLKDINYGLAPLTKEESFEMIRKLKNYKMVQGVRGREGANEDIFAEIIVKISNLVKIAPEIYEMDLNPLLGKKDRVIAVDSRIRIEKDNDLE